MRPIQLYFKECFLQINNVRLDSGRWNDHMIVITHGAVIKRLVGLTIVPMYDQRIFIYRLLRILAIISFFSITLLFKSTVFLV